MTSPDLHASILNWQLQGHFQLLVGTQWKNRFFAAEMLSKLELNVGDQGNCVFNRRIVVLF